MRSLAGHRVVLFLGLAVAVWGIANLAAVMALSPEAWKGVGETLDHIAASKRPAGFQRRVYHDSRGGRHHYVVFVPEGLRDHEQPPVILYLNGHGKNGDDGLAPLLDGIAPAVWERISTFPFLVVWPQCPVDDSWSGGSQASERALAILRRTIEEYRGDSARVYLTGLSSGGRGVWSIAAAHPEVFAAIAPMSASGMTDGEVELVAKARLPVWSFSVDNDGPAVVAAGRRAHGQLLRAGLSPRLTELSAQEGGSMYRHDAWSYAYRNSALYGWLLSQRQRPASENVLTFEMEDESRYPSSLVAGESPEPVMSELAASNLQELHLEFRADQGLREFGIGAARTGKEESLEGLRLALALDSLGSSNIKGFSEQVWRASTSCLGAHAVLPQRWNDLRLRFTSTAVAVELNGWQLGTVPLSFLNHPEARIVFAASGSKGAMIELRNLRTMSADIPKDLEAPSAAEQEAAGQETSSVSLAAVIDAWRRHESSSGSVQVHWITDFREFHSDLNDRLPDVSRTGQFAVSKEMLTLRSQAAEYEAPWRHPRAEVSRAEGLQGEAQHPDFLRALHGGFRDSAPRWRLIRETYCDATRRADQLSLGSGAGVWGIEQHAPLGWGDRIGNLDDLLWRVPLLALRPLSPWGGMIHPESCRLLPGRVRLNGVNCVILEELKQHRGQTYLRRIWVDPARDFLILRGQSQVNGRVREDAELNYRELSPGMWRLSTWRALTRSDPAQSTSPRYFPGNELLFEVASATIVDWRSESLHSRDDTEWHFRSGTLVFEQPRKTWFKQSSDGQRARLSSASVAELAARRSASMDGGKEFDRWMMAAVGILTLTIVFARCRRFRKGA